MTPSTADGAAEWRAVRPIVAAWVGTDLVWAVILVRAVRTRRRRSA